MSISPMQITTNVITPGVEMSIFIALPDTTVWTGTIRRADAPKHGRHPASGGQLWCPACEAPVEECREAAEIRRRVAELEGRVDD